MQTKFPELFLSQSAAIAVAVLALFAVSSHAATALAITTWNLEHMMSEKTFDEWSAFCAKYDWDEDKVKAAGASASKPKHLTYCNAHNGLLYPTTVPESLPLHSRDAFAKKVATLAKRRAELNSDVFALQEIENESAARRIFPESEAHKDNELGAQQACKSLRGIDWKLATPYHHRNTYSEIGI